MSSQELYEIKMAAYKTVATFAGICGKKMWLKDCRCPCTDGHAINVPFQDPDFYLLTEHEISHNLFESNASARNRFIQDYATQVEKIVRSVHLSLPRERFELLLRHTSNILEDYRCDFLWAKLYPGSGRLMAEMNHRDSVDLWQKDSSPGMAIYLAALLGDVDPSHPVWDKYKEHMIRAANMVEGRGFVATLIATRWLITQLVTEFLKKAQTANPPKKQQMPGGNKTSQVRGNGADGDEDDSEESERIAPTSESTESKEEGDKPSEKQDARANALLDLIAQASHIGLDTNALLEGDFQTSRYDAVTKKTLEIAKQASGMSMQVQQVLEASARDMQCILNKVQKLSSQNYVSENEWLQKEAMAKVNFRDVRVADISSNTFKPEDALTVNRLRGIFYRVQGKKKVALTDSGTEIDTAAYISQKVSGSGDPCFKTEEQGRGFKALILVDCSGSMRGEKERQVDRACQIICRSIDFPFTDVTVWGFTSFEGGGIDLIRYEHGKHGILSNKAQTGGTTPLHIAVRLAVRQLSRGNEAKHLFVLTDGKPCAQTRQGANFGDAQLMTFVKEDVHKARSHGIGVTALLVGNSHSEWNGGFDVTDKQMSYMFGHQRHWDKVRPDTLHRDLVQQVSLSFVDYLQKR